jgi:hypothetical protein
MSNITAPPEIPHELDAVLEDENKRVAFRIEDDSMATWAMRKLAAIRAKQKETEDIAEVEIQRVRDWVETVNRPLETNASFFEAILKDYGLRQRHEADRKSINLPHGKVATRAGSDKWNINGEILLPWLRDNFPELIKVKEEPSLSALKDAFAERVKDGRVITDEGEVLPGVTVDNVAFTVSVSPTL